MLPTYPPIARATLFHVLLFCDLLWPGGRVHIPAGSLGRAILSWGGARAGIQVEWEPGVMAGLRACDENKLWCRVPPPPVEPIIIGSLLSLPVATN